MGSMSLALATLIYEWRRYLAAVVALAFSGLLVMGTVGMFTGIVHSVLATTERSRADLFVMPANTPQLINSDSGLPARVQPLIYLNPEVVDVESFTGGGGKWVNVARPGQKQITTFVQTWAVDPEPGALTLPVDYPDSVRLALREPGAVVVDVSDLPRLGVRVGEQASLDGHTVTLRAVLHNYQDVNQPTVIMSRDTARRMGFGDQRGQSAAKTGPLMVRIRDPAKADVVRDQLNAMAHGDFLVLTRADLNRNDEKALLGEQIIGVLLIFFIFLSIGIGIGITSQTLRGAILSNIREFASLRALGISMGSLRLIVMELSFWVGVAGLGATALLTFLISFATSAIGLPMVIRPGVAAWVSGLLMVLAVISGAMAMGILKKSQPADLLR
jgi:putative ABC transport system permease protein